MRLMKLLAGLGIALLLVLMLEGAASFFWLKKDYAAYLRQLPTATSFKEEYHAQHDPEIGWVNIPGKTLPDFYGPGRQITINKEGVRGSKEYGSTNNLVVLGDSFTLGYGVGDEETFPAHLQKLIPEVNVVNMGQGGYSLGQCVLWYQRDGVKFKPDCLVLAIIVDDIWRMGSALTANGYHTPNFTVEDGKFKVSGQPLPKKVSKGDPLMDARKKARFFAEHVNMARVMTGAVPEKRVDQEGLYKVAEAAIDALNHPNLIVVLLPELQDLTQPESRKVYHEIATRLARQSQSRDWQFLDLMPAFLQVGPQAGKDFFLEEQWHHYSEQGNAFVAKQLRDSLGQHVSSPPEFQP